MGDGQNVDHHKPEVVGGLADKKVRCNSLTCFLSFQLSPNPSTHSAFPLSPKVISVAAGSSTSYAVTADGEGYAWGFGENLQLTNGEEQDELVPILMTGQQLEGRKVLQVC